jgi:hypothetical protein
MHRSSKRIVAPLFLLLVAAVIFVPEVRADEIPLLNFSLGSDTWTLPQEVLGDSSDFTLNLVPVFEGFLDRTHTFDMHFFRLDGASDFIMSCDPFLFNGPDANQVCDYFNRVDVEGNLNAIWTTAPDGNPMFLPRLERSGDQRQHARAVHACITSHELHDTFSNISIGNRSAKSL